MSSKIVSVNEAAKYAYLVANSHSVSDKKYLSENYDNAYVEDLANVIVHEKDPTLASLWAQTVGSHISEMFEIVYNDYVNGGCNHEAVGDWLLFVDFEKNNLLKNEVAKQHSLQLIMLDCSVYDDPELFAIHDERLTMVNA